MSVIWNIAALPRRRLFPIASRILGYRYAFAAADQLGISLFNFGVTFALVRLLSATEFGTYGLWIAAANLAINVQAALVCTPLGVHAPAQTDPRERRRLEGALGSVNLLFVGFVFAAVLAVNLCGDAEWIPDDLLTEVAIPTFVALELYREYSRSVAFGRQDMPLLMLVDAPYVAITGLCIGAMLLWPQHLAGLAWVFVALTLGSAGARIFGWLRVRIQLMRRGWTEAYRGIFGESMWMLAGVVSTHIQARSYAYITTGLVGLAQLASINAVGLLFRPANTMLVAWRRSALPQLSELVVAGDTEAFDRRVYAALAFEVAGFAALCGALWLGWDLIDRYFLAAKYPKAALLLLPWAIVACLEGVGVILSAALQAMREFRYLAYVTIVTAPITAAATVGFTLWHGFTWTLYGLAIGNIVNESLLVVQLRRIRKRGRRPAAPPDGNAFPTAT